MPRINKPTPEPRPPVPSTEAAKILRVHRKHVADLIGQGRLKATKGPGGKWLVDADSLDAYAMSPRKAGFPYGRHRTGGQRGGGRMLPD